jgi:iron complex transport system substrate-binding protein
VGGGLIVLLVAGFVYRPHLLQGDLTPPVFPPHRIVSLNLAADEILLALTPPERIAALTDLADDPRVSNVVAEARGIPHKVRANAEQVIALQPDLVIVAAFTSAAVKALLREAGVPLLELHQFTSLAAVTQNILAVGHALGEIDKARALVAEMERHLGEVRQRVANAPRPRVLYYSPGGFTAGSGTMMDEMITGAGGQNVATEVGIRQAKKISQEKIVVLNPAVILVSGDPRREGLRELLLADPTLQDVEAIRHGRVHTIPRPYTTTVSQYVVQCMEAIAQVLHPDLFPGAEVHE